MLTTVTFRPRNVDAKRAGAILYGDWGTSKAYVIGLAFALAGYSSFWLIAAVSLLSILVGINYTTICRYYPNGGGVYASVRHRSPILSMIGAFFIIADYLVTAALSALSAAFYFGISDPILFAAIGILVIGLLNYFGPRHVGTYAFGLVTVAIILLILLALLSIPHLPEAWHNITPLKGSYSTIWTQFVGVIVALSGIEAIANATGIMKLNPGSTNAKPSVTRTSTKAIVFVMLEVALFTSLFGFAAAAISNFEFTNGTVNAPGNPNVRDYMLRYMGEVFAGNLFGHHIGEIFGWVISCVIGLLLFSAVNTAITGLVSLQYIMAGDSEVPRIFQKVNPYGVPIFPLIVATLIPILLVVAVRDVAGLAALYAIGFVGAIATNLGSTSTDFNLGLKKWERGLMFFTFIIMAAIEITLFIDKPEARVYVLFVIVFGLFLRGFAQEFKIKRMLEVGPKLKSSQVAHPKKEKLKGGAILCPTTHLGRALNLAIEKSKKRKISLHVLFVREQNVITDSDILRRPEDDHEAMKLFDFVRKRTDPELTQCEYRVSDSKADTIASYAMQLDVTEIFLDMPKKGPVFHLLKGNLIRDLTIILPDEIHLLVIP